MKIFLISRPDSKPGQGSAINYREEKQLRPAKTGFQLVLCSLYPGTHVPES